MKKNITILNFDFYLDKAPTFYEKRDVILISKEKVYSNLYQSHNEGQCLVISGIFWKSDEKIKNAKNRPAAVQKLYLIKSLIDSNVGLF